MKTVKGQSRSSVGSIVLNRVETIKKHDWERLGLLFYRFQSIFSRRELTALAVDDRRTVECDVAARSLLMSCCLSHAHFEKISTGNSIRYLKMHFEVRKTETSAQAHPIDSKLVAIKRLCPTYIVKVSPKIQSDA